MGGCYLYCLGGGVLMLVVILVMSVVVLVVGDVVSGLGGIGLGIMIVKLWLG